MKTFVTSDIHLNHRNILTYCPHRGGPEVSDELVRKMNENIISNWNSTVSPEDTVWILGDVAMGLIDKAPALIRRLNGTKHLILGNHDKTLNKKMKTVFPDTDDFRDLFASVQNYRELTYTVDGKKYVLVMSHYPMAHWNGQSNGAMMLHGHLHGNPSGVKGRVKDVGMDTNNLFPYLLDDVVRELIKIEVRKSHHD